MGLGTVFGLREASGFSWGGWGEHISFTDISLCLALFTCLESLTVFKCDHVFSSLTLNLDWLQALNWWVEPRNLSSLPTSCCFKWAPFSAEGSRVGAKQSGNLQESFEARWALKVCRADEVTLPGTSDEGLR